MELEKKELPEVCDTSGQEKFQFWGIRANKWILHFTSNPLVFRTRERRQSQYEMRVEELSVMSESAKRLDFKDKILPHLEVLLQFSLWLTKNGRDATRLMCEAMAEAYRSWDELIPEENCGIRLHKILTRRFFSGFQQYSQPLTPISDDNVDNVDDSLIKNNRLFPVAATNPGQQSFTAGESDEDVNYFTAIAGLPAVFRSAMILSYLEGFSYSEIADLAGVQPHAIESLLNRGREFLREELFAHLLGSDSLETVADRTVAAG
jgi:RNA polymerase sigma-70 factor (ECF subfamily)